MMHYHFEFMIPHDFFSCILSYKVFSEHLHQACSHQSYDGGVCPLLIYSVPCMPIPSAVNGLAQESMYIRQRLLLI